MSKKKTNGAEGPVIETTSLDVETSMKSVETATQPISPDAENLKALSVELDRISKDADKSVELADKALEKIESITKVQDQELETPTTIKLVKVKQEPTDAAAQTKSSAQKPNIPYIIIAILAISTLVLGIGLALSKSNSGENIPTPPDSPKVMDKKGDVKTKYSKVNIVTDFDFDTYKFDKMFSADGNINADISKSLKLPTELPAMTATKAELEVTPEQIDEAIQSFLTSDSKYVKSEDAETVSKKGDSVTISYSATYGADAVEIPNIKGTDERLVIGDGNYMPGFDDLLIGHKVGDEFECKLVFDDSLTSIKDANEKEVDLTGVEVTFAIKISELGNVIIPELTDEWVTKATMDICKCKTVDELKEFYKNSIYYSKLLGLTDAYISNDVLAKSEIKSLPPELSEYAQYSALYGYAQSAKSEEKEFSEYIKEMTGKTSTELLVESADNIENNVLSVIVYDMLYDKAKGAGAPDISTEQGLSEVLSIMMGYKVTPEDIPVITSGTDLGATKNNAKRYAVADYLAKELMK